MMDLDRTERLIRNGLHALLSRTYSYKNMTESRWQRARDIEWLITEIERNGLEAVLGRANEARRSA